MLYNLCHITDFHLNPLTRIPQSRSDKFHTDVSDKWDALNKILDEMNVTHGLISGDIFHLKNSKLYTPDVINYYTAMFQRYPERTWLVIPGNHDLPKSALANLEQSAFKTFINATPNVIDISNHSHIINDPRCPVLIG